jgi:hypothetical protein
MTANTLYELKTYSWEVFLLAMNNEDFLLAMNNEDYTTPSGSERVVLVRAQVKSMLSTTMIK